MSGKRGDRVWQRNRYKQYSYKAFIPFNPRTAPQMAIRQAFSEVSKRWRTLSQPQREAWIAVAWNIWSKPRLSQCGRLTGCMLFVKINVALVHRGLPQVDWPTERSRRKAERNNIHPKALPRLVGWVPVSKQDTGRGGMPLRYRSSTVVCPYYHRSTTLPGRWSRRSPQKRLRYPCRSQPVA